MASSVKIPTCPKKPTIMSERSISRRHTSMVEALEDISVVMPHLRSTGTNSYPALLHIDASLGQYFLVSSSLSSSNPPKGELKNTRAVWRALRTWQNKSIDETTCWKNNYDNMKSNILTITISVIVSYYHFVCSFCKNGICSYIPQFPKVGAKTTEH